MANIRDFTPDELNKEEDEWYEWARPRPLVVRKLAARFRPWKLYRMKSAGHRVLIYSLNENGTVTVVVLGKYNLIAMERRVFGIHPDDLEECDLPGPDEPVGVWANEAEQLMIINGKRAEHNLPPLTAAERDEMLKRDGMCVIGGEHVEEDFDGRTDQHGSVPAQPATDGGVSESPGTGSDDPPAVAGTPDPA